MLKEIANGPTKKTNSLKIKGNKLVGKQISDIDPFRTFID